MKKQKVVPWNWDRLGLVMFGLGALQVIINEINNYPRGATQLPLMMVIIGAILYLSEVK